MEHLYNVYLRPRFYVKFLLFQNYYIFFWNGGDCKFRAFLHFSHFLMFLLQYHFVPFQWYPLWSLVCHWVCGSDSANPECHGWWHKVIKCATPLFFHGCQGSPLVTLAGTHAMGTSLALCGGLTCRVVGGPMCSQLVVNIIFQCFSNGSLFLEQT